MRSLKLLFCLIAIVELLVGCKPPSESAPTATPVPTPTTAAPVATPMPPTPMAAPTVTGYPLPTPWPSLTAYP